MKKIRMLILGMCAVLLCAACGKTTDGTVEAVKEAAKNVENQLEEWKEQLNLGLRCLLDGQYEEAIVALTKVIEIEPKCVEAYKGRGDAYYALAAANGGNTDGTQIPEKGSQLADWCAQAQADYEKSLQLLEEGDIPDTGLEFGDEFRIDRMEIYEKLADVYLMEGDVVSAMELLGQAYEALGDPAIQDRLTQMQESVTAVLTSQRLYGADGQMLLSTEYTYDENRYLVRMETFEYDGSGSDVPTGSSYVAWELTAEYDEAKGYDEWMVSSGPGDIAPTPYYYNGGRGKGADNYWNDERYSVCANPYPEGDVSQPVFNTWAQENGIAGAWYSAEYTLDAMGNPARIDSYDSEGNPLGYCELEFQYFPANE